MAEIELASRLGPLVLANPVMPASGCFGPELGAVTPVGSLGAVVTKTVFADRRPGNKAPRLAESGTGMLNSVGIPSTGLHDFCEQVLPAYRRCGVPVIVSVGGLTVDEYGHVAAGLPETGIAAVELNVSCPNLEHGGLEIGADPRAVGEVVATVRASTPHQVIVKLTPNVTSITELARAAEDAGATAVTVANTFVGLAIDIDRRRPLLGNGAGGYSGPPIKALALRLVWQTARAMGIPVIGCGGITSAVDVAEFLIAGASAVQVGTATFSRPQTMQQIVADLPELLRRLGAASVSELVGTLCPADASGHPEPEEVWST